MSQSASHFLRLVSLSSLCSAAFSACLSLRLVTAVSRLSGLLFHLLALLFASSLRSLDSLLCCFLPFSLPHQSLVSLFCCFFHLSHVSLCLAAVALSLTPLLLLDYYTLHEHRWHSLGFRCRRCRCHPPIVKICCTPHYMGLT